MHLHQHILVLIYMYVYTPLAQPSEEAWTDREWLKCINWHVIVLGEGSGDSVYYWRVGREEQQTWEKGEVKERWEALAVTRSRTAVGF